MADSEKQLPKKPTERKLPFVLDEDQGFGVLSARALWASLVGPHRLAMSPRKIVNLKAGDSTELTKNLGASDAYVLVGLAALPGQGSVNIFLGRDPNLGNGSWPVSLLTGGANVDRVTVLLMPGEQLFAQEQNGLATPIVVASAIF